MTISFLGQGGPAGSYRSLETPTPPVRFVYLPLKRLFKAGLVLLKSRRPLAGSGGGLTSPESFSGATGQVVS